MWSKWALPQPDFPHGSPNAPFPFITLPDSNSTLESSAKVTANNCLLQNPKLRGCQEWLYVPMFAASGYRSTLFRVLDTRKCRQRGGPAYLLVGKFHAALPVGSHTLPQGSFAKRGAAEITQTFSPLLVLSPGEAVCRTAAQMITNWANCDQLINWEIV